MKPGTGVITSCSMFLHRHYVVLDRESHHLGQHLQAIVLDPVTTRGTRVFLEFTNCSETTIVNPGSEYAEGILRGALIDIDPQEGLVDVKLVTG